MLRFFTSLLPLVKIPMVARKLSDLVAVLY
jgi:hypothetical protein